MSNIAYKGNDLGSGTITIETPNTNTDRTLTLPDAEGTLVANTSTGVDITGTITTDGITEDTSGNVGIGVTPENYESGYNALDIGKGGSIMSYGGSDGDRLWLSANAYYNNAWKYKGTDTAESIAMANGSFEFRVAPSGTADTDISWNAAMAIDNGGRLLLNSTSYIYTPEVRLNVTSTGNYPAVFKRTDLDGSYRNMLGFQRSDGTIVGNIKCTSSATQYNTSSDYRLKEDVQPMSASIDRLKQLNPVNFAWKETGDRVDGFLAHEAQEVVPEAVSGTKDAMRTAEYEVTPAVEATYDEEGNELTPAVEAVIGTREVEDYQGIDQSKLVPLLTSALQEAVAKIEELETRITTLEGGV